MELLSQSYGWTPSQIREQKLEDINAYLEIIKTRNAIEKSRQNKNK